MGSLAPITLGIIAVTTLISWQGWQNLQIFHRLKFEVGSIRLRGEYDRMLSSALLHADMFHLLFNMFALYIFANPVLFFFSELGIIPLYGSLLFLALYVLSIFGGSLLSLFFHKNELNYSAVGASGGVSGVVFASVMIFPDMPLQFILFPFFDFPAWAFGIGYLLYSIFGMQQKRDNIGHAAHLGGATIGIVFPLVFAPTLALAHPWVLLGMLAPIGLLATMMLKQNK